MYKSNHFKVGSSFCHFNPAHFLSFCLLTKHKGTLWKTTSIGLQDYKFNKTSNYSENHLLGQNSNKTLPQNFSFTFCVPFFKTTLSYIFDTPSKNYSILICYTYKFWQRNSIFKPQIFTILVLPQLMSGKECKLTSFTTDKLTLSTY